MNILTFEWSKAWLLTAVYSNWQSFQAHDLQGIGRRAGAGPDRIIKHHPTVFDLVSEMIIV